MQKNTQLAIQKQEQNLLTLREQRNSIEKMHQQLDTPESDIINLDWYQDPNDKLRQQLASRAQSLDLQIKQQEAQLQNERMLYAQWQTKCGTDERRTIKRDGNSVTIESQTLNKTSDPSTALIGLGLAGIAVWVIIDTIAEAFKKEPVMFTISLLIVVLAAVYIWMGKKQ